MDVFQPVEKTGLLYSPAGAAILPTKFCSKIKPCECMMQQTQKRPQDCHCFCDVSVSYFHMNSITPSWNVNPSKIYFVSIIVKIFQFLYNVPQSLILTHPLTFQKHRFRGCQKGEEQNRITKLPEQEYKAVAWFFISSFF